MRKLKVLFRLALALPLIVAAFQIQAPALAQAAGCTAGDLDVAPPFLRSSLAAVQIRVPAPVQASGCTEGEINIITTGPACSCEDGLRTPKEQYKCLGGQWVLQSSYCGAPFCRDEGGGSGGGGGGGSNCCWWYTDCHVNSSGEYECTPTVCGLWGC